MPARLRRLGGWLTLAAFFGVLAVPVVAGVHLAWNDDSFCEEADLAPRHATQLTTEHAPIDASHCAVCHWMRAVASATPRPATRTIFALIPRQVETSLLVSTAGRTPALEQPSRAPPDVAPLNF
jgi:hypothetical protein